MTKRMTKASFKTLRESLGLTPKYLASRARCHPNIIWRIESPLHKATPSYTAAERELQTCAVDFDMAAERLAALARKNKAIERPPSRAAFEAMVPELADWPDRTIGLLLAEVQRRTKKTIEYPEA